MWRLIAFVITLLAIACYGDENATISDRVYLSNDYLVATGQTLTKEELQSLLGRLDEGEIICNCTDVGCGVFPELRNEKYKHICKTKGGCQKLAFRDASTKKLGVRLTCVVQNMYEPRDRPFGCFYAPKYSVNAACCHDKHFCAANLEIYLETNNSKGDKEENASDSTLRPVLYTLGILMLLVFVIVGVICCIRLFSSPKTRVKQWYTGCRRRLLGHDKASSMPLTDMDDIQAIVEQVVYPGASSGSGAGAPLMVQRTIARQIILQGNNAIGVGKFGEVWLGSWKTEPVAVKIFHSFEEKSWFREVEIYQTNMLRHPNILGFIASDNIDTGTSTQLWLVTEYHSHGSLYDYLTQNALTQHGMCRMIRSIANGLTFLHNSIEGTHTKPAMAHRDLKSKNILVKNDLTCCIADLGMAVRYMNGCLDRPVGSRVGTRRYLPPEVLDSSINEHQFDSFRRADIYSLGLVIWEIAHRTESNGKIHPFELPYYDMVPADPSMEQMHDVVCVQQRRPTMHNDWLDNEVFVEVAKIMNECWATNPASRLTALRVKKTVDKISESIGADHVRLAKEAEEREQLIIQQPNDRI